MENHLEKALLYAGLDKLPEPCNGAWKGEAIVLIKKVGGKEEYCIGTWNAEHKRANIAMDFGTIMEDKFIKAFPIPDRKKEAEMEEERIKEEAMRLRITRELDFKEKLKSQFDVEDPEGTLEELEALYLRLKNEKGDPELDVMKEFLLGVGYDEGYCKRLTIESAKKSVEKIQKMQDEIKALGAEPETDKNKMEEQLKALKKKEKEE